MRELVFTHKLIAAGISPQDSIFIEKKISRTAVNHWPFMNVLNIPRVADKLDSAGAASSTFFMLHAAAVSATTRDMSALENENIV